MMSLLIVILAITLSALVVFGGVSYFSHDFGIRTEASTILKANYETIVSGIMNYRTVNNGMMPETIDLIAGYLPFGKIPQFPRYNVSSQPYLWKIEGDYVCLYRTAANPVVLGIDAGLSSFITSLAKSRSIKIGQTCVRAVNEDATTESVDFKMSYLDKKSEIAFAFKVN